MHYSSDLDIHHPIPVDADCACAFTVTDWILFEIGLKPSIMEIASAIVGTVFSNDSFGLYQISALLISGSIKKIKHPYYLPNAERALREAIQKCLQDHQTSPMVFFINKVDDCKMGTYLGRGRYSQVSSTSYMIRFRMFPRFGIKVAVYEEKDSAWRQLIKCGEIRDTSHSTDSYVYEYRILERGESITSKGIQRAFVVLANKFIDIGKCNQTYLGLKWLMLCSQSIFRRLCPEFHSREQNST